MNNYKHPAGQQILVKMNPSFFRRLGCLLYEVMLCGALLFLVTGVLSLLGIPSREFGLDGQRTFLQLELFIVLMLYFGWFWSEGRVSLAMRTWRVKLTDSANEALTFRKAITRYCYSWIGPVLGLASYPLLGKYAVPLVFINYFWTLVDREKLFLHDRLAKTRLRSA